MLLCDHIDNVSHRAMPESRGRAVNSTCLGCGVSAVGLGLGQNPEVPLLCSLRFCQIGQRQAEI